MERNEKEEEMKTLVKEDSQKGNLDIHNNEKEPIVENKAKGLSSDRKQKKKHKEKKNKAHKINGVDELKNKDIADSDQHIINKDELFTGCNEQREKRRDSMKDNYLNINNVMRNTKEDLYNMDDKNLNEQEGTNIIREKLGHSGEKISDVTKTSKISDNAELVVEPLIFEEKLNLWKGTINSVQIKKEDEKKQQEERLRILENVKLAQILKKEEEMLHKEYMEQLKKDEELAKQIEQKLHAEVADELHKIEESDFQLAQKLQSAHDDKYVVSVQKSSGTIKKLISLASSNKNNYGANENNDNNNNNDNSAEIGPSKTQQLKDKFRNLFKKKKKNVDM